jgi:hypothetical protein
MGLSFMRRAPALVVLSIGLLNAMPQVAQASGTKAVIYGTPTATTTVGRAYSYTPTLRDAEGDTLRVRVYNRPAWLNIDRATGRIYGTPTAVRTHSWMAFEVSDGTNYTVSPWFSIKVVAATTNSAPMISGVPAMAVSVNTAYSFQPTAKDSNGDSLAFSIANKPAWATFSTSTGRLSGTPTTAATHNGIVVSVSDGKASVSLPSFNLTVNGPANRAPVISGTAATSVSAGSAYSFRPTASDADGNALTFSVANRPSWAAFNTTTGQLSGTPTAAQVGTYSNIAISVSDGKTSTSLAAFSVAVVQASVGSAALNWTPPTQNSDGSALTDLAGYRIYYGTSAGALTQTVQVASAGMASYVIENLAPATYYFALKAYSSTGAESTQSNVVSKTVQ